MNYGLLLGSPSNVFFFQLAFISWMVTLGSCLICQIISFILPPNENGCDTLEQRWEILRHYFENHGNVAKMQQNHLFGWSWFWSWWVCKQAKLRIWGTETRWHRWTIICWVLSKISVTPTIFVKPLLKYSCTQSIGYCMASWAAIWMKLFPIINRKDYTFK